MAAFVLLAAACSNESEVTVSNAQTETATALVRVHVNGFSIEQTAFARTHRAAQDVADYDGVSSITLAFYASNGTEVVKTTQSKGEADFGEFSLSLPMGTYTMVALAYYNSEASPLSLTSPTVAAFTGTRAYETFAATQEVTISNTEAVDISTTLSRIVTQLKVVSTDGKTADVTNVRMSFAAGGKSFNPSTGLATVNTGFSNTVNNSAAVGAASTSLSFLFLATDEQNIDVTIETLDADGNTLFSKTIENVPFKRNRITKLTGAMYTNEALSGSFQVETAWIDAHNANF